MPEVKKKARNAIEVKQESGVTANEDAVMADTEIDTLQTGKASNGSRGGANEEEPGGEKEGGRKSKRGKSDKAPDAVVKIEGECVEEEGKDYQTEDVVQNDVNTGEKGGTDTKDDKKSSDKERKSDRGAVSRDKDRRVSGKSRRDSVRNISACMISFSLSFVPLRTILWYSVQ